MSAVVSRALLGHAMSLWWLLPVLVVVLALLRLLRALVQHPVPDIQVYASDYLSTRRLHAERNHVSGPTVRCFDPATLEFLGHVPALRSEDVKMRVLEARKAQKEWADSSFDQRRTFLRILLKYILGHQELICQVSARDSGKTMVDAALGEIITTCEKIDWLLKEGERWLKPEYRSSGKMMLHKSAKVEYLPLGVIGAIVPWNYPFHNIFNPMLAAVFAGNGIVIKVSEHASWSGLFYMRIIEAALAAAGAPSDLVHVITGFGETGEALVSSVDKVIFVGSTAIGRKVMETAAKSLTPVVLELGGKDAFIVCEDADLSQVIPIAARGALQSSGQNCAGAERFYVHSDIYKPFVHEICQVVTSVRVGSPLGEQVDMGAICMPGHAEKLEKLVQDAVAKGAKVAARGQFVKGVVGHGQVGQFFLPTVLVDVNHSMTIMQEEVFGPIVCIMPFSSDEEAIGLANDCKFGLGGSVFSANGERAKRIAAKMSCGMVAINDFMASYMCQALPFGGVKESGIDRMAGVEGLRGCCLVRSCAEDRIPFVKTVLPKLIQYPVADNAFEFEQALVKFFYGLTFVAKLQGLFELVRIFFSRGPAAPGAKKKA